MKCKGYYGIGIERGKTKENYWTLFRTAQILDADFIFLIGEKFKRHAADTMKSYRHMPTFSYTDFEDFNKHRPYNCRLIGVEMVDSAILLEDYKHPEQACYLLGSEDNGLSRQALNNCQEIIKLHGKRSFNIAVAGSIILYDRYNKLREEGILNGIHRPNRNHSLSTIFFA